MSPPRVLIVDDSMYVTRAAARALARLGYDVVEAHTGEEARGLGGDFDLGLFDLGLDGECGIQLAEQFLHEGRVRRIVLFTGEVSSTRLKAAEKLGPVLDKTDGARALADCVEATLRVSAVPSDVAPASGGGLG